MRLLYDLFLLLYTLGIRVYGLFNGKARKWTSGRKGWQQHLGNTLKPGEKRIWVHCSSVGEFEQARPLIEALKQQYAQYKIAVTFFSPSGFEACKKNNFIDYIFYLPMDGKSNAVWFIGAVRPSLAIFIKYEFWYHYLHELKQQAIPALLVSGAFRVQQPFFKWYGGLFRRILRCFSFFFVQDEQSKQLLNSLGFENVTVSGDTRYDRVSAIAGNISSLPAIEKFKAGQHILIAGSTWPGDEAVIKHCMPTLPFDWKLIIAPHEIDAAHVEKVEELFGNDAILYSSLTGENTGADKRVLIINNIGMLSRLFAYGDIAFIGGGFQKGGIHNILEPAVFGLPVIFGPVYEKFVEAKELASLRYVFPVNNAEECTVSLGRLLTDEGYRKTISDSLYQFMREHVGATKVVMNGIRNFGWL